MILAQLRSSTRYLHERVERAVNLSGRLQSRASYTDLLVRYYGFYKPFEERLAKVVGDEVVGFGLKQRLKTPMLLEDLITLGKSSEVVNSISECDSLPAPSNLSEAFGCLYVLEGATLGGQIVRKQVEREYGLVAGRGCSFFSSYGDEVGSMWKKFCAALEAHSEQNPGVELLVVGAAVATFSSFAEWFAN